MVDCEAYTKAQLIALAEERGIVVPPKVRRGLKADLCHYVNTQLGGETQVIPGVIPSQASLEGHQRDVFFGFRWDLGNPPEAAYRLLNPGTNEVETQTYTEEELNTPIFYGGIKVRLDHILDQDPETEAILDSRETEKALVLGEEGKPLTLREVLESLNRVYTRENSLSEFIELGAFFSKESPETIEELATEFSESGVPLTAQSLFDNQIATLRGPLKFDPETQSYSLYVFYTPV